MNMKVKDPFFTTERIEKYLEEDIKPSKVIKSIPIENFKYYEIFADDDKNNFYKKDSDLSKFSDFKLWDTWGGYDKIAWFKTNVFIPKEWISNDYKVCIKLIVGPRDGGNSTAESLLYIEEEALQGIDVWHEEAYIPKRLLEIQNLDITLKSWSGVLSPPRHRTFKLAELNLINPIVDKFYFLASSMCKSAELLNENDLRRVKILKVLRETFKIINFLNKNSEEYYESIAMALKFLNGKVAEFSKYNEIKPLISCVGHSHIDMAWLWRLSATREKASRTFSTVLNLMEQYDKYKFMHSSPKLFKFLKEDYPEIFEKIKQRVKEGRFEITGGAWVEFDTNIPSGESLVRQFLFGKNFLKEEFDLDTKVVWMPDVFGYSPALPQIIKKSGLEYFMTTKISWSQYNHFPYDTFNWKGIDGSEVLTHFITTPEDTTWFYTYNGRLTPDEVQNIWSNYRQKDINENLLLAYGWGDGGGGPTREMIETGLALKNIPGINNVELTKVEQYFETLSKRLKTEILNVWDGELYLEYHRGVYTSQAFIKKANRKIENLLHDIEIVCSFADILRSESLYPQSDINNIWERVLLNQFHDILPGTSIKEVYDDCKNDYKLLNKVGNEILESALDRVFEKIYVDENSVIIFNTLSFTRDENIFIEYNEKFDYKTVFLGLDNKILKTQHLENGVLVFFQNISPLGYTVYKYKKGEAYNKTEFLFKDNKFETPYYIFEINDNGEINYLFDKEFNRMISTEEMPLNVFTAYEDKPLRFDAWDIDVFYKDKPYKNLKLISSKVIENGNLRLIIKNDYEFNKSTISQEVIFYSNNRRIDFKTHVDWKESQVLLKVYFPVDIRSTHASFEVQYGHVKRSNNFNSERDFAKFEVCAHKWIDISEGSYGVSILNDCKYGYDVNQNLIGISLIKSAIDPDANADKCEHEFTYSLYPHNKCLEESVVQKAAASLNSDLYLRFKASSETSSNYTYNLFNNNKDNIFIDCIKKSEKENAFIVRLYEYKNTKTNNASISFNFDIKRIVETNLVEEEITEYEILDNKCFFNMKPFEIKTFKFYI